MTVPALFFAVGFILLLKGAEVFTHNGAKMACGAGISPMTTGFTLMAFGASVPDVFIGIAAGVSGNTDLVLGNGIGTSIASMLLVLGVTAVFRPIHLHRKPIRRGILFILTATGTLWIVTSDIFLDFAFFSVISRSDALILLCFFCIFRGPVVSFVASVNNGAARMPEPTPREIPVALKMIAGCLCLTFGARCVVDSAAALAGLLEISQRVMGLTVIAMGTALPKLMICLTAARRGYTEMAVGTVTGAVFFNIFFVLGISGVLHPIPIAPAVYGDMGMLTLASGILFIFLFVGRVRVMGRPEGGLAILLYVLYLGNLLLPHFFPA